MKKQYEAPKVEIQEFEMENTLCTSGGCAIPFRIPSDTYTGSNISWNNN